MARQEIDLTTPQPNGKMGEPTKSAWEKVNDMTEELYAGLDTSSQLSGRNMLINCGIPVNQRNFAGGALAAGAYGYDRWKAGAGGCNVSIDASTGVFTHNSGPLVQVIESPISAWGSPLTISVENPSASISVSVGGASGTIPAGTGRVGVTLTPSGSGNMTVQLSASGATYSRPQLERGESASSFEFRNPSLEILLCQRYYFRGLPFSLSLNFPAYAAGVFNSWATTLPTTMRAPPVVSISLTNYSVDSIDTNFGTLGISVSANQWSVGLSTRSSQQSANAYIIFGTSFFEFNSEI